MQWTYASFLPSFWDIEVFVWHFLTLLKLTFFIDDYLITLYGNMHFFNGYIHGFRNLIDRSKEISPFCSWYAGIEYSDPSKTNKYGSQRLVTLYLSQWAVEKIVFSCQWKKKYRAQDNVIERQFLHCPQVCTC